MKTFKQFLENKDEELSQEAKEAIERSLTSKSHFTTSDQAFQSAQDHWFNDYRARKLFKDRHEFAAAVKKAFEEKH